MSIPFPPPFYPPRYILAFYAKIVSFRSSKCRVNFRYNIYFPVSHSGARPKYQSSHQRLRHRIELARNTAEMAILVETPTRAHPGNEFRRGPDSFIILQFLSRAAPAFSKRWKINVFIPKPLIPPPREITKNKYALQCGSPSSNPRFYPDSNQKNILKTCSRTQKNLDIICTHIWSPFLGTYWVFPFDYFFKLRSWYTNNFPLIYITNSFLRLSSLDHFLK